jgi:hypothetical protein
MRTKKIFESATQSSGSKGKKGKGKAVPLHAWTGP